MNVSQSVEWEVCGSEMRNIGAGDQKKRIHPGAEKKLAIECGAGEITIDFSEQE